MRYASYLIQRCSPQSFFSRYNYCRHPSIRTLDERSSLGASWVFSFQPVLPPDFRPLLPSLRWKLGQAIDAVTETRRLNFGASCLGFLNPWILESKLCRGRQRHWSLVPQWFVSFSAHPQPMQQHRQLARHRNHRSFLPILSPAFRQFQSPPS
jgi:hypothetical protein